MDPQLLYELIGYAASVLVAISLMMRSILRLRVLNLVGATFFTIYGLVIGSYPVAAVNAFIVLINIFYLRQIFSTREYFDLLPVQPGDSYLQYFLDQHKVDIQHHDPGFSFALSQDQLIYFFLRDLAPAGLLVAEQTAPGRLFVQLDYVIPRYRDLKLGRFLYKAQEAGIFHERGIHTIESRPGNPVHSRYLQRMGFNLTRSDAGDPVFRLQLQDPAGQPQRPGKEDTHGMV